MSKDEKKVKPDLALEAACEDFAPVVIDSLKGTIVSEIIDLMFLGEELEIEGVATEYAGSEIIGEINLFERACHVLWQDCESDCVLLKRSLSGIKKHNGDVGGEESYLELLKRAETAKSMMFESIFRRHPPELNKYYYVGTGGKIIQTDMRGKNTLTVSNDLWENEDALPIMLFSAIDAKKIGNA